MYRVVYSNVEEAIPCNLGCLQLKLNDYEYSLLTPEAITKLSSQGLFMEITIYALINSWREANCCSCK